MKHICQGPKCHEYETQSRIRGPKGAKVLRTRFARYDTDINHEWIRDWETYYCDERCLHDWLQQHMTQLINFVGLKTKPSETEIEVVKEIKQGWRGEYVDTTIKLLNDTTQDDTVTV